MYFGNYYDALNIELQTHQVNMKVIHICQTAVKANHNEIIYVICYVPCVRCRVLRRTVAGKNSLSQDPWIQTIFITVIVNFKQTFFKANDAVCPARSSFTGILFRWIVLTTICWNCPRGSGPSNRTSLSRIVPRRQVPDTTVPTP